MATIEALYSWIAAFIGIGLIAALHYHWLSHEHLVLVVGSFGASAVLIFGTVNSYVPSSLLPCLSSPFLSSFPISVDLCNEAHLMLILQPASSAKNFCLWSSFISCSWGIYTKPLYLLLPSSLPFIFFSTPSSLPSW